MSMKRQITRWGGTGAMLIRPPGKYSNDEDIGYMKRSNKVSSDDEN